MTDDWKPDFVRRHKANEEIDAIKADECEVWRRFNKLLPSLEKMPLDDLGLILGDAVLQYFSVVSATALHAFIHERVMELHTDG